MIPQPDSTRRHTTLFMVLALVLYWVMAVSVSPRMGVTADEVVHLTGGYSYWAFNDYRLHPENGTLPMRLAALPLLATGVRFPSLQDPHWVASKVNLLGEKFFFQEGNDVARMLLYGRMMIALTGTLTLWLIWRWARGLFGPKAGWLALGLAMFCPAMLTHGGLITSDMTMTACMLAAITSCWLLLHRATWARLGLAALACGLVFLSKMSGVLIIPLLAGMVALRCLRTAPLVLAFGGLNVHWLRGRGRGLVASVGLLAIAGAGSLIVLWGAYGFRYSGFNLDKSTASGYYLEWDVVLNKVPIPNSQDTSFDTLLARRPPPQPTKIDHLVEWLRDNRLLPEAYLWGFAHTHKFSLYRPAYLMGEYRTTGWREFFPLAFLLKTPLAALLLFVLGVAALAASAKLHRLGVSRKDSAPGPGFRWLYRASPLLLFFVIYWIMAVRMNLNIGHRHILPTYPIFYILASASVLWLNLAARRIIAVGLVAALTLHITDSLAARPFYISYFQPLVGGSAQGYRYLVDSSYDWGQGLPDLAEWLDSEQRRSDPAPVHLCYFGADSARVRSFDVVRFGDEMADFGPRVYPATLKAGWYAISATNLVQVYAPSRGQWGENHENLYREILARLARAKPPFERSEAEAEEVLLNCRNLEIMQTTRICNYLRDRTPLEIVGGSILIFKLTAEELQQVLYGPPPENAR
jgi:4-amino-4-deoxy-L-arabinose transferase-like glycosyltransferase